MPRNAAGRFEAAHFARAARRDLDAIVDYIALDNPAAAEKTFRAIVAAVGRLIDFPDMGHAGRLPDTRELNVRGCLI